MLMAIGVIGKIPAYEHRIQELAATPDFRERRIVLQSVRIYGRRAIEVLTGSEYAVRPTD